MAFEMRSMIEGEIRWFAVDYGGIGTPTTQTSVVRLKGKTGDLAAMITDGPDIVGNLVRVQITGAAAYAGRQYRLVIGATIEGEIIKAALHFRLEKLQGD